MGCFLPAEQQALTRLRLQISSSRLNNFQLAKDINELVSLKLTADEVFLSYCDNTDNFWIGMQFFDSHRVSKGFGGGGLPIKLARTYIWVVGHNKQSTYL